MYRHVIKQDIEQLQYGFAKRLKTLSRHTQPTIE
jgi:hypothetical protein